MLILGKSESYKWPVKFEEAADGGRFDKFEIEVEFKRLSTSRRDELAVALSGNDGSMTDQMIVDEVVVGWGKVKDENDNPLPFSAANLRIVIEQNPALRPAIVKAFFDSLAPSSARKN